MQGEKYLVLKKKYRQLPIDLGISDQITSPINTPDISTPLSPLRVPPPYRPPPPAPLSPPSNNTNREESCSNFDREEAAINARKNGVESVETGFSTPSPPVPPRRKSQDKVKVENKENVDRNRGGSEAVIKVSFFFFKNVCKHKNTKTWNFIKSGKEKKRSRKKITIKKIFFFTFRLEFDKISRFFIRTLCSTYVVYSILVVVVYVNKCANDKMVEHVFALSGNY